MEFRNGKVVHETQYFVSDNATYQDLATCGDKFRVADQSRVGP